MIEEPQLPPDPVVIPGQDPAGPLPGSDSPDPLPPPEFGPDSPPIEMPNGPVETPELS